MTRRDPVLFAWAIGLGIAALVYVVGPDHFLFRLENALHIFAWQVAELLADLSATALDLVRALSIGLFVTFLGLAATVSRRGGRSRGAMIVVSIVFLVLVGGATAGDPARWLAALVLSGVAAAVMTGRLRQTGLPAPIRTAL